ncbi:MAG: phosphonoacetaldehyde hydrolase [Alphaproteobacteria bacterium]
MTFHYRRNSRGPLRAILLDWAGTTMDYGCMAPAVVFMDVFKRRGVPITIDEARAPMGAHKKVHIQRITELATVAERWRTTHGRAPGPKDVASMFEQFVPLQVAVLSRYSKLIPGTLKVVDACRKRRLKVGSTTGYNTEMMRVNLRDAARQGYVPDATVCASDVPHGRPYPFMCLKNMIELEVSPVEACVKVDDTLPGIEEGLNAGMWTIGLAVSGNEIGLPAAAVRKLARADYAARRDRAYGRMRQAGAHYVVDSIADILPCLDDIERRLGAGERP